MLADRSRFATTWVALLVAACAFLGVATFYSRLWVFDFFNLRDEGNLGALFSGMLLLVAGLHAFDGWFGHRATRPRTGLAWLAVGGVLVALSFDEIGSLHERVPSPAGVSQWWVLLPFAVALLGPVLWAFVTLAADPGSRARAWTIAIAFGLFGSVAAQEALEHRIDWPDHLVLVRAVVEEGTELVGFLLLTVACLPNTQGRFARDPDRALPVFDALTVWRAPLTGLAAVGIPLAAIGTVALPEDGYGHGKPADWPAAALFLGAGIAALQPWLRGGQPLAGAAVGLAGAAAVGCAATTLTIGSSVLAPAMAAVVATAVAAWKLDGRLRAPATLAAAIVSGAAVGVLFGRPDHDLLRYCARSYVALGLFTACVAPRASAVETPSPAL